MSVKISPEFILLHPDNPCRPVDWRWQLACEFQKDQNFPFGRSDKYIKRIVSVLRRQSPRKRDGNSKRYTVLQLPIFEAIQWYRTLDRRQAFEISLHFWAGSSDCQISEIANMPFEVIQHVRHLFFDRLDSIDTRIALAGFRQNLNPPESFIFLHAACNGPWIVPYWLDYFDHAGQRHDLSTEIGRQRESLAILLDGLTLLDKPLTEAENQRFLCGFQFAIEPPRLTLPPSTLLRKSADLVLTRLEGLVAGDAQPHPKETTSLDKWAKPKGTNVISVRQAS